MFYPSASKWQRVMACPASWVLPQDRGEVGDAAKLGTAVHKFLEDVNKIGRKKALAKVKPFAKHFCEALNIDDLPVARDQFTPELRMAWWPETGKAEVVPSDERFIDGAVTGMVDVIGLADDHVYIEDYKTARTPLPDPKANWQLRVNALLAARTFGKHKAVVAIRWLRGDGGNWVDRAEYDPMDLDTIEDQLKAACVNLEALEASGAVPEPYQGPHCRWCPAYQHCPAKVAMLNALVQAPEATVDSIKANLTEANAPEAYARWKQLKELIDRVGAAVYAFAAECPIDAGEGMELRLAESKREYLDGEVVHEVLLEKYGAEVADIAVRRTASKKGLEDALRPQAKGPDVTLKGVVGAALSDIRAKDGARTKTSETVKLVKRKVK